jgi:hypothetical protein
MATLRITSLILAPALAAIALAATTRVDSFQGGAVPPAVLTAEGLAEDVQTDLDTSGWQSARAKVAQLQTNRPALRNAVGSGNVVTYEAALDSLIVQTGRRDRPASLESANAMSRALLAITSGYDITVPIQVGYLDVAGRDAIYRAEAGRWQDAAASSAELRANYAAVRAHVAGKDPTLDVRLRQRLNALDGAVSAKNAVRVRVVATGVLDDVDLIERTY